MQIRAGLLIVFPVLVLSRVFALTDEEIFRDFRFNLINPGARSLALGGAFISLADDATAAQANPAGLSNLLTSEGFLELRAVDNGAQSGVLREAQPGVNSFVATGTNLEDIQSPSFASAVFPLKTLIKVDAKVVLGVSRQEVLHSSNSTVNSFLFTFTDPASPGTFSVQGAGSLDVRQTNYNLSVGYRVPGTSDRLALGASLAYSRLGVRASVANTMVDTGGNVTGSPIREPTLDLRTSIHDGDSDLSYSLGAIFRPPIGRQPLSVGVVFRSAPKFAVREVIDPPKDRDGDGTVDEGIDTFHVRDKLGNSFRNTFNIPDSYGVGVSWQPSDRLTLALDAERIRYSQLLKGYVPGVNVLTDFDARFTVADATDFRLGVEYVVLPKKLFPIALRGGAFTQSDNTIRAVSTGTSSFATKEAFPGRDRHIHGAAGVGLVLGQYKIDLALDLSRPDNQYLVSLIYKGR